jgi:hypothetical protein
MNRIYEFIYPNGDHTKFEDVDYEETYDDGSLRIDAQGYTYIIAPGYRYYFYEEKN